MQMVTQMKFCLDISVNQNDGILIAVNGIQHTCFEPFFNYEAKFIKFSQQIKCKNTYYRFSETMFKL